MKTGLIILIVVCSVFNTQAQSIISNRTIDFSVANIDFIPDDVGNQIIIVDSNTYLSQVGIGKKAYYIRGTIFFNPSIIISDSSFNFRDTISFPDTVRSTRICYDKKLKQIWMVSYGRNVYSLRMRRLNLRGEVLSINSWPRVSSTLLIPDNIQKLYPDGNGGFYLLGSRPTTMSGQSVEPWMVSRFDSNGTVLWQREFIYTYAYGRPQYLEKLPNGRLYISGYAGRQIFSLILDSANGNVINRKVIYNYPDPNRAWSEGHAIRCANGGYFIRGYCIRNPSEEDSSAALATIDSSLVTRWQNYSRYSTTRCAV